MHRDLKIAAEEGDWCRHHKPLDSLEPVPVDLVHTNRHDGDSADREADHGHSGGGLVDQGPGELGILEAVEPAQVTGSVNRVDST